MLAIGADRDGTRWKGLCPNPDHDDESPSWSIVDEPGTKNHGSHHCFSCGFGGGPWELVAAVRGISVEQAGKWLREVLGGQRVAEVVVPKIHFVDPQASGWRLPTGVKIPSEDGSKWFPPALRYLAARRVTASQVRRWRIGFATSGELEFRIVVPVVTGDELVSYVARSFTGDSPPYLVPTHADGARPDDALFGEERFDDGDAVTVSEGVFKVLRLEQAGAPNPCAVLGATNLGMAKLARLERFDRLFVAGDPDAAGDRLFDELRRNFPRKDVRRLELEHAPDDSEPEELSASLRRAGWTSSE